MTNVTESAALLRQPPTMGDRLDVRGVSWFLAIAFGLAWLLDLPLWLSGAGLASPWALLIMARNVAPALAVLLVTRWLSPLPHIRANTGLRRGAPCRGWWKYWLYGWLGFTGFNVAAPFIGALFDRFPLDVYRLSAAHAWTEASPEAAALAGQIPVEVFVWGVILSLPIQALLVAPFAFGEEWGWRGYLLPRLLPFGQGRALVLSGALWGLWHAPLILLGLNYPLHPRLGVLLMMLGGIIFGTLLGWTRLASGSVWPAVLGHAAFNANQVLGGIVLLTAAGSEVDTAQGSLLGWTGWLLPLLVIAILVIQRRLPVQATPEPTNCDQSPRLAGAPVDEVLA